MRRDRLYLKNRFLTGSRPTQADFHDLIDSFFNHLDDTFENFGLTIYNPIRTYNINDTCIYNGCIYICLDRNVSGPFNPDKWDFVTEMPAIYSLNPWQSNINYNQYDIVRYKGKAYYSKLNNNIGNIPTNTTWWQEVICTRQNMVNWQPGVYFKDQKIIHNDNIYQVNCNNYTLSINISADINAGKLISILTRKFITSVELIQNYDVVDLSNNYIIEIDASVTFYNGYNVLLSNSNDDYLEVTIFDLYQDKKWRIKEVIGNNYTNLYHNYSTHNIIRVEKNDNKFIISGEITFRYNFLQVKGSSGNDGFYRILNIQYDNNSTIITVDKINSEIADGYILNYNSYCRIVSINKIDGCILKINNILQFRPRKFVIYKLKTYELISIQENYLVIDAPSLPINKPYGSCTIGKTLNIQHNLNNYYLIHQIYTQSNYSAPSHYLEIYAFDTNNIEIDVKDPGKYAFGEYYLILMC